MNSVDTCRSCKIKILQLAVMICVLEAYAVVIGVERMSAVRYVPLWISGTGGVLGLLLEMQLAYLRKQFVSPLVAVCASVVYSIMPMLAFLSFLLKWYLPLSIILFLIAIIRIIVVSKRSRVTRDQV